MSVQAAVQADVARVRDTFLSLQKAIKAINLYMGKGPLVERAMDEFHGKLSQFLAQQDALSVSVTAHGFLWSNEPVYESEEGKKGLSYKMFKDGIREVTFARGVAKEELLGFLDVMRSETAEAEADQDTVTLLWEKDFKHIAYSAVDLFLEGGTDPEEAERFRRLADRLLAVAAAPLSEGGAAKAGLGAEDLAWLRKALHDEAVIRKADEERAAVALEAASASGAASGLVHAEMDRSASDLRRKTMQILLCLLLDERSDEETLEVVTFFTSAMDELIEEQRWDEMAEAMENVHAFALVKDDAVERRRRAVGRLLTDLASEERINAMAAKTDSWIAATVRLLTPVFRLVPPPSRPRLIRVLSSIKASEAREVMQNLLVELGVDLTEYYSALVTETNVPTARGAVSALRQIGTPRALAAIKPALRHQAAIVRKEALVALSGTYDAEVQRATHDALESGSTDLTAVALEMIARHRDSSAGPLLVRLAGRKIREGTEGERKGLLVALAAAGGDETLRFLRRRLLAFNLFRSKAVDDLKILIGAAIAASGGDAARALLERAMAGSRLSPRVRDAIQRAAGRKA